jgi:hypothetical protein
MPHDAPTRDAIELLRRGLHLGRGRSLLLSRSSIAAATAASTTVAAIATATIAATMAAMMATMMATTTAASATAIAAAAIAAAAATMTEGHRLVVTAQQGDADDREENRETENNNTVHPQILQLLTGTS